MSSPTHLQSAIEDRKSKIIQSILRWYNRHQRKLLWRKTHSPYRILVSEIMLQQTQVSRVLIKYPEFLKRFPSFAALADSSPAEVIRAWQGMGYNNRALRLRQIAMIVTEKFHGQLPKDIAELQHLPGIGKYTAHAIACFAFKQNVPVVDTNIRRVLRRMYGIHSIQIDDWHLAELALPRRRAYDWNQALMDLGAMVCTASMPHCSECPVQNICASAHTIKAVSRKKNILRTIPDRIYRGKLVEALRNASDHHPVELHKLGRQIKDDFIDSDIAWLQGLAEKLQRDGLIELTNKRGKFYLTLPT